MSFARAGWLGREAWRKQGSPRTPLRAFSQTMGHARPSLRKVSFAPITQHDRCSTLLSRLSCECESKGKRVMDDAPNMASSGTPTISALCVDRHVTTHGAMCAALTCFSARRMWCWRVSCAHLCRALHPRGRGSSMQRGRTHVAHQIRIVAVVRRRAEIRNKCLARPASTGTRATQYSLIAPLPI